MKTLYFRAPYYERFLLTVFFEATKSGGAFARSKGFLFATVLLNECDPEIDGDPYWGRSNAEVGTSKSEVRTERKAPFYGARFSQREARP